MELTPEERRLRLALRIFGSISVLGAVIYLLPALFGPTQAFFVQLPFVTNSFVKVGMLALLAFLATANVRRRGLLIVILIWAHVMSAFAVIVLLLFGKTNYQVDLAGGLVPVSQTYEAGVG